MGDDGISEEDKLKIATQFMLAAPPGEFNEVVSDVRGLVGDDALLNRNALATFRTYNTEQFVQVKLPGSEESTLVTKWGEIDNKHYLDPHTQQVFEFDHVTQKVGEVTPNDQADPEVEAFRAPLDKELAAYVKDFFTDGTAAVYGKREGGEIKLFIAITGKKFNPRNYWNGRWRSNWEVSCSRGTKQLQGSLKVTVHYYEEGNVQLNTKVDKTADVVIGGHDETAKAIAAAIRTAENAFQAALEESYNTMSETTFKGLRRKLPISGVKINFQQISQHRVGRELGSGAK
eukprot:TRINITY_DN4309_c0_g1_i1.p2 TRINITY_DN4309_c0_g1~~TRINITY_DN4309_c0_g1_i1.p2  ORF type:complete len:301 (+),score=82.19 TRINITY_DN4309_c0_g1_i1:42-905(+)